MQRAGRRPEATSTDHAKDAAGPHVTPEGLFDGSPFALAVVERVRAMIDAIGPTSTRTGRTQIGFRRRRGFAWLWPPVFGGRGVDVVLSIALDREDASTRWKQVVHPAPRVWMHHLELRDLAELDGEVEGWLREAFELAG